MTDHTDKKEDAASVPVPMTADGIPLVVNGKELTKTQRQALREAKARKMAAVKNEPAREVNGADRTTDPTRYGDWEKGGRAVDF
ncbi:MAG: succinate dehydrogenase assembly factor 4 [Parvularculaceae bacterium]